MQRLFDCRDKVALVTGGGSGLGRYMAEALAEAGAHVVVCSRQIETCTDTADYLQRFGVRTMAMACDVTDSDDVDRVVDTVISEFGTVDILVNNSGTSWGAPALEMPLSAWHKVVDTNLTGVFVMSQRVGREMVKRSRGKIINVASVAGLKGFDSQGLDAVGYSASKGGVIALTKDLSAKWAPFGITVNAIAPGFFPTKMSRGVLEKNGEFLLNHTPLGRFGDADDIRGVIIFLSARASDYMTGSVIVVDGGLVG